MATKKLLFAGIFISALMLTSCVSNEILVDETPPSVVFAKTTEMLNFESSLKSWMLSKKESEMNSKQRLLITQDIEKNAKELLVSLGKNEIASKSIENTDELIRIAMKEYSKKLTEMYNQQKNN
jgi:CRISPR/Cas system type I-B associated protein Csh2 (Cas7 group RAMP superfamily)